MIFIPSSRRPQFVDDGATDQRRTTVRIMSDFYDAVRQTGDALQALADAQRDCLVKLRKEKGLLATIRLAVPFIMRSQGKSGSD